MKESTGIKPVALDHVEAALPFMPRPVAAMVRLQMLTGCRTGEILVMRGCDLTPGESIWEYRPSAHKNAWRGHQRVIPLGPRAQAVVREFLKPDPESYLFSPRDVVAEFHARRAGGARQNGRRRNRAAAPKGRRGRDVSPATTAECTVRRSSALARRRECPPGRLSSAAHRRYGDPGTVRAGGGTGGSGACQGRRDSGLRRA